MVNLIIRDIEPKKNIFSLGGVDVTAVDRIPFEKKLECAAFIATRTRAEDEISGVMIYAADSVVTEMQAMLMYYTDANVEGMSRDVLYRLYDMLMYDEEYAKLVSFVSRDFYEMMDITGTMRYYLRQRAEKKNSRDPLTLLGNYLSDEKPDETIAKSREVNDYLIDVLGKAQKYDEQKTVMSGGIQGNWRDAAVSYSRKD